MKKETLRRLNVHNKSSTKQNSDHIKFKKNVSHNTKHEHKVPKPNNSNNDNKI